MSEPTPTTPARPRERIVTLKFGGRGLSTGDGVRAAVRRVAAAGCERPPVVVSAIGEVTDLLDRAADEAAHGRADASLVRWRHKRLLAELELEPGLLNRLAAELEALLASMARHGVCAAAERDHVLSFGERMSARILSAALRASGLAAAPVDAWELGLVSDSNHGSARPLGRTHAVLGPALARMPGIPVVTGFVAVDAHGRLTTLGRNGSDLSASLVAEAAGAAELQLWKTVPGVLSADPALVPQAHVLPTLDHAQARALAFHGASVLHPDALDPLARAGIQARVADLEHPERAGTRITQRGSARGVIGLAGRRGLARATVPADPTDEPVARSAELFAALARHGVEVQHLEVGPSVFELVVPEGPNLAALGAACGAGVRVERGYATLAVVVAQPWDLPLADAQGALSGVGIEAAAWSLDAERGAAVALLPEERLGAAARALHEHLLSPAEIPRPADSLP